MRRLRATAMACVAAALAACAQIPIVPDVQQAWFVDDGGTVVREPLECPLPPLAADEKAPTLDGSWIRVLSWNIHKNGDPGWDSDLAYFANSHDLVLLQEAALTPAFRQVVEDAGHRWLLASAFSYEGRETGVLTSARIRPAGACTQRRAEPLLRLPKAAVIARYRLKGSRKTLLVANLHSINFSLALGAYQAQVADVMNALAKHDGPVIFAGDLNTWSPARYDVIVAETERIGLEPVKPIEDLRRTFLGRQVDYMFVRGLDVVSATAYQVKSSDHNPLAATLRLPPGA